MIFRWFRRRRDRALMIDLVSVAAEGEKKAQIRRAIATLKNIDRKDDTRYSAYAACELASEILRRSDLTSPTDDDLYAGGIFTFIIADHISFNLEGQFEAASCIGAKAFLASHGLSVEDAYLSVGSISQTYNQMVQSSGGEGEYLRAVGRYVAIWCHTPSEENICKLVELFDLGRKTLK